MPLTQEVLPPGLSQPPLPPLDDDVQVEIQPDLSLHEDCSFSGSDRTPTVEAIVVNKSTEQLANDSSNRVSRDPGWEQFFGRKIKFKGEGVRAPKSLFLQSPGEHPEIPDNLYMNGIITAVPWRGQQEYALLWDYTVLPVPLDKSAIVHTISKTDNTRINDLKMARFIFDRVYPNGVKSVPNIAPVARTRNRSAPRRAAARATTSRTTRSSRTEEISPDICQRQRIADMRMAPINNQIGTPSGTNSGLQFGDDDDSDDNVTGPTPEDDDPEEIDFVNCTEERVLTRLNV